MEHGAVIKHNIEKAPKTGDWRYMKPEVDKEKCIGCGTCVSYCPDASIILEKYKDGEKNKADIDYDFCKGCGVCAQVCPVKAILMKKN
jgi:pyruvate ferredoxin oxidoreductase delta subunit